MRADRLALAQLAVAVAVAVAALAMVVATARDARAQQHPPAAEQQPRARLAYVHDASIERCPTERELKDSVSTRLGYDPFASASPDEPRQILVQVRKKSGATTPAITGALEILGPKPGQKELGSPRGDCRELVDALAVAIALAIDPASLSRPPAPPPPTPPPPAPPEPSPDSEPLPPPIVTHVDRPAEPEAERVAIVAGVGPRVFFNELPSVVPAAALHIGLRWRWFEPRIEGVGTLSGSASRAGGGEVSASLLAASLLPCAHVSFVYGCAGATLGSLRGEGVGINTPQRASDFYASVDVRGGVEIEVTRAFSVQLHLDVVAPLTRVSLQLDGRDVFTVPAIGARLGVAAAIRF